jgi:hypothetical protein
MYSNFSILKFSLEDTSDGCYRDIQKYLIARNWARIPTRKKKSILSKKVPCRRDEVPLLYWLLNEKDVDFSSLHNIQIVNHFEGISKTLTTKLAFCDLLRDMIWFNEDSLSVAPR